MDYHRCSSEQSLITVRKWLLESGDGLSTENYNPSSKLNENKKEKTISNKIIKRKKENACKFYPKISSMIDWIYDFIKNVFTVYESNPWKSDEPNSPIETCSSYQFNDVHTDIHGGQSTLPVNIDGNRPMTIANSKTDLNDPNQLLSSPIYPLYCFSVKDGQMIPLNFSSQTSSTIVPFVKEIKFSSVPQSLGFNQDKKSKDSPIQSSNSHQSTIASQSHSTSKIVSLETTENFIENSLYSKKNSNAPEIIFAESTCQLIKQTWFSSKTDQQTNV